MSARILTQEADAWADGRWRVLTPGTRGPWETRRPRRRVRGAPGDAGLAGGSGVCLCAGCGLTTSGFCVFKWLKKEDYLARRGSARKPKCQPASFQPRPSAHVLSVAAPVCSGHKPKVCAVWPSPENGWCRGRLGPRDREPVVMPAERERGRRPGVRRARTASSARRGRPALPSLDTGSTWGARGE